MKTFKQYYNEINDLQADDPEWNKYLDYINKSKTTHDRGMSGTMDQRLKQYDQQQHTTGSDLVDTIYKAMLEFRSPDGSDDTGLQGTAFDKFFRAVVIRPKESLEQWIAMKTAGEKPGLEPGDEELYKIGSAITGDGVPGSVSSGHIQDDKIKQLEINANNLGIRTVEQANIAIHIYKAIEFIVNNMINDMQQRSDSNVWFYRHVYSDDSVPLQAYINKQQSFDFHDVITKPVMDHIKDVTDRGEV